MKVPLFLITLLIVTSASVAQNSTEPAKPFSTWSMYFPDVLAQGRATYPIGVLTPTKAIVVRRVEDLSNRGPFDATFNSMQPVACRGQFTIEVSDGASTQVVPISNTFVAKNTSQTYTDSGQVDWLFSADKRISIAVTYPKPQVVPVNCTLTGLNVTLQYELAGDVEQKTSSDSK